MDNRPCWTDTILAEAKRSSEEFQLPTEWTHAKNQLVSRASVMAEMCDVVHVYRINAITVHVCARYTLMNREQWKI